MMHPDIRDELFSRELWENVAKQLHGSASDWWGRNRDLMLGLPKAEIEDMLEELRDGDTFGAKVAIARRMDRHSWRAYRRRTTEQLTEIARRRVALMDAIEDLLGGVAKVLGSTALGILGV